MSSILKNILLLIVVLVLSYFTAVYFGFVYDYFTPGFLGDGAWIGTTKSWQSIIGFPLAFVFFHITIFKIWGYGKVNEWIIGFLLFPIIFFAAGDLAHIYLPIALGLIAYGLAYIISKIFKNKVPR